MSRPGVALDVDGVLAADPNWIVGRGDALRELGYRAHEFDGFGPNGAPARGMVWLNPEHGVWLRNLLDRDAELVWATSWGQVAADWIAPRLGLPELPVIEVPHRGPAFGWSAKTGPIQRWIGDQPLVWIDDEFGGKEPGWAEDRRDNDGVPTLLHSAAARPRTGADARRGDPVLALIAWKRFRDLYSAWGPNRTSETSSRSGCPNGVHLWCGDVDDEHLGEESNWRVEQGA